MKGKLILIVMAVVALIATWWPRKKEEYNMEEFCECEYPTTTPCDGANTYIKGYCYECHKYIEKDDNEIS